MASVERPFRFAMADDEDSRGSHCVCVGGYDVMSVCLLTFNGGVEVMLVLAA